jgi:hypothetical protein
MKCFARLLAVLGLCASAAAARAAPIEEFNVNGWIVGAYSDNRTGEFTHCATSVPFRSGTTLFFHLGRNFKWSMGLHNPQWRNAPGNAVDLIYYIDEGPQTRVRAQVTTLGLVSIPLADSKALFEAFRRGRRLYVVDSRERYVFDLANSGKALQAVYECVQRHGGGGPGPSYGPAPGPSNGPAPGPRYQTPEPAPRNQTPDPPRGGAGTRL